MIAEKQFSKCKLHRKGIPAKFPRIALFRIDLEGGFSPDSLPAPALCKRRQALYNRAMLPCPVGPDTPANSIHTAEEER